MSRYGDTYENSVTGERAVVLRGDDDGDGQSFLVHLTVRPHGAVVGEHVHPHIAERFRVISGRLGTRVDGVERTLVAGQEAVARVGTAHDWWNAGEDEAQVLIEIDSGTFGAGPAGRASRRRDRSCGTSGLAGVRSSVRS